jgi:pSer/pThr/pTyr-binding forkhead associated (FHA) protein
MNLRLRVVRGRPAGKELTFGPGDYYLGRGPECQVCFNSEWVSRQHCLLRVAAGGVTLRDPHSRNGTLVNGALVTAEQALRSGDQVQIGPVVFEVDLAAGARRDAAARRQRQPPGPRRGIDRAAAETAGRGGAVGNALRSSVPHAQQVALEQ